MKTINIKGKEYIEVNERIKEFRKLHKDGSIHTELLSNNDGVVVFKALIFVNGELVSTGHAYEKEGSTFINKTSYIENCETSAVGRALGIFGIGIDTSVASAEEVGNAVKNQAKPKSIAKHRKQITEIMTGNLLFSDDERLAMSNKLSHIDTLDDREDKAIKLVTWLVGENAKRQEENE